MPRATSQKFSQATAHKPAPKKAATGSNAESGSTKNAIFNTAQFGQHILKNPLVAQSIVDKAGLKSTDKVLEVGPGTGNLTVRILDAGVKSLKAVEMDPRMAAELLKRIQSSTGGKSNKLELVVGDFIKLPSPLDPFDVCISNTPYQVRSSLYMLI